MSEQIQQFILRKNHSYRDQYRRTIGALIVMALICMGLTATLIFMNLSAPKPKYYASTITGHVTPMHALNEPVITNKSLLEWVNVATRTAYNLDFLHYQNQLKGASIYFSQSGFGQFKSALDASGLLDTVKGKKLIMSAVVSDAPVILNRAVYHGRFTWRVQMPVLVTFNSASESEHVHLLVTLDVARVPALGAPQGIQIIDFQAETVNN